MSMAHLKVTGKEDVTSNVLDPPFTNLFKEVITTKNLCSLDDFLVMELPIKRRITALVKTFAPVSWVESECFLTFRPRKTPLFLRGEKVNLLFPVIVKRMNFVYLQCFKECVQPFAEQEEIFCTPLL